jgi:predicted metal-dependent HD superfamily phosphohydrolase
MQPTKAPGPRYLPVTSLDMGRKKILIALNLAGFAMLFVFGWLFFQAADAIRPEIMMPSTFLLLGGPELLALVAGLIAVLIAHELFHGLFFWIFTGERFELGIRPFYAFASSPEWYLPRSQFSVIGLAPFIIITLLGFALIAIVPLGAASVVLVSLVVNAAGSVGDFVVVAWLLAGRRKRLVRDTGPVITIYEPVPDAIAALSARWLELVERYGLEQTTAKWIFTDLVKHYNQPGRYYHTLEHVEAILDTIGPLESEAQEYDTLQLAVWFHDVIFEPLGKDNEARSAEYAFIRLREMGLAEETASRVAELIMMTTDHQAPEDDIDGQILIDADLAPFGLDKVQFDQQSVAIRKEFSQISDSAYRESRRKFLKVMMEREPLYYTEYFNATLESKARENIAEALEELA